MTTSPDQPDPNYGRSPTDKRYRYREFLHQHIVSQRTVEHALPTNIRALYYVGKETAWSADGSGPGRKPSQDVSDATQWLIDRGLVHEDEVTDANGHIDSFTGTTDVLASVLDYTRTVVVCPWSPNPIPALICEGRNDLALVAPIGQERRIRWVALGGMAGRGHLRRFARTLDPATPIGYIGDWNRTGHDIERNAERFLRERGWNGTWTRLLVTDEQAPDLSPKEHTDGRDGITGLSVETAAMPVGAARTIIHDWLDTHLPDEPDADDSARDQIVEALEALADDDD